MNKLEITAASLINTFNLLPHPEGGYYKEIYRSKENIPASALSGRFSGNRCFSTAIYFLLNHGDFSAFHRIKSDECWHFYAGNSLNIYIIYPDGHMDKIILGQNITANEHFQYVVPAGCWFASEPATGTAFSFVGCTVAPGFDFDDFELAEAENLIASYPQHKETISRLCRK